MSRRHALTCAFCARTDAEVELLFRAEIGGLPPCICDRCIALYHGIAEVWRMSPAAADQLVAEINQGVESRRRKPRPARQPIEPIEPSLP